ncbi:MAG TPA: hypothetical protein VKE22_05135 [Haliangiales bacterium]|nr:hypothetical protein [Haliangiales bacterium]
MSRSSLLLRLACALVMVALVVELVTLFWSHPLSFIAFATVGGAALGIGLLLYLYWLVWGRPDEAAAPPRAKE